MASTVWRGYISFGLISIPVRLYRAARAERVSFRRLYRATPELSPSVEESDSESMAAAATPGNPVSRSRHGAGAAERDERIPDLVQPGAARSQAAPAVLAPVQQAALRRDTGELVPARAVVKGFEVEKNRFVEVEPEELKSVAAKTSTSMEIEEFVSLSEIDPVYFETSYYVTPEEAGEKAYALLYRSLQLTALVAIARFAMHSREHVVVLRPGTKGILAHTMFFASEVRADEEFSADWQRVNTKELELAQTLVRSLAATFEPEKYSDTYRARLEELIASKISGSTAPAPVSVQKQAEVVDIADALRRSLANLKKPAASDQPAKSGERRAAGSNKPATGRRSTRGGEAS